MILLYDYRVLKCDMNHLPQAMEFSEAFSWEVLESAVVTLGLDARF